MIFLRVFFVFLRRKFIFPLTEKRRSPIVERSPFEDPAFCSHRKEKWDVKRKVRGLTPIIAKAGGHAFRAFRLMEDYCVTSERLAGVSNGFEGAGNAMNALTTIGSNSMADHSTR